MECHYFSRPYCSTITITVNAAVFDFEFKIPVRSTLILPLNVGSFSISLIFSLNSSALDHSATAPQVQQKYMLLIIPLVNADTSNWFFLLLSDSEQFQIRAGSKFFLTLFTPGDINSFGEKLE